MSHYQFNRTGAELGTMLSAFQRHCVNHPDSKLPYNTWRELWDYFENNQHPLYLIDIWTSLNDVTFTNRGSGKKYTITDNIFYAWVLAYNLTTENKNNEENENNNEKEEKGENTMFNFEFGPVDNSSIRLSLYGLAVKNASGTYVAYDAANNTIVDVEILNFKADKMLFKMPVALKDIQVGDIVIHARKPMYVTAINENNTLSVVDPVAGEVKDIMLARSPFGFDFVTKVVNLLGNFNFGNADSTNPFGNMLPFLLMSDDSSFGKDMNPLLLMMMANNGQMTMDNNNMLPWLLLLNK